VSAFRLALASLLHDRGRSAVSVTGAAFAILLVFMQLGFLGATKNTATILYDKLRFDVIVTSSEYLDFSRPGVIDRLRLAQARSVPGVAAVRPVSVAQGLWRNPTDRATNPAGGKQWSIVVLGVAPDDLDEVFAPGVFADPAAARTALGRLDAVLLDRRANAYFGHAKPWAFGRPAELPVGQRVELTGRQVEFAGYFEVGTGFSYTGLVLANEETFVTLSGRSSRDVTFGLVRVNAGANPTEVAAGIQAAVPGVLAFPRAALGEKERDYWVNKTSVGQLFVFGVVLALMVGAIFVYQMMAGDIKKHLPEYATLKAIGYRFGFLFRVVVWQALFLAVGGYLGGLAAAVVLYRVTTAAAGLPMSMPAGRLAEVLALSVVMCVGSGLVAVRKVRTADPADLF